jgi:phosphatidylinositol glycan class B
MERRNRERDLAWWIIGLAFVLRAYAAVAHLDISHPDEHFQTLEPASHVVYGFGWLSWEWSEGTRSWFVPGLYMPLLWLCKVLGFKGGPVVIQACRVLMALLSTAALYQFWVVLRDSGFKFGACLLALAVFAFSPACVAWSAMTLSDVWAVIFLWCSMPFVLRAFTARERMFTAGVLLGLSFLARIQMVLFPIGMLAVLVFRKPFPKKEIFRFLCGYGIVVLFQGALDWVTWGAPFHSVILNIQKNLFEHVAAFYGTAPFYEYLRLIPANLGPILCAIVFSLIVGASVFKKSKPTEKDLLIGVPALLYLAVHSLIAHKELRFMLPIFPAFFYLLARGLDPFIKPYAIQPALIASLALIAAVASSGYVYSSEHTYPFDLSELTRDIRDDGGLSQGGCLLLVDHYWIWTRGEMMIGAPVKWIEESSRKPFPETAKTCPYAISLPGRDAWFAQPGAPAFKVLKTDNHGQVLLKRVGA